MFDWITGIVEQTGYVGVALLMLAENIFPPIPSEMIMPLAGFTAARGDLNVFLVTLSGSIGSLTGALGWYFAGAWIGPDRLKRWAAKHGRWLTLRPRDVDKVGDWFHCYGGRVVLFGRLIPTIRTLISVPAGIARMAFLPFLIYSGLGTVTWTAFLAAAGYLLHNQYDSIAAWLNPLSNVVFVLIALFYFYRVATFERSGGTESG
jgi:membrane protein DedA with SNARE-associated domain